MSGDAFNEGGRYGTGSLQCIDALEVVVAAYEDPAAGLLAAQAIRYLWRSDRKGGVDDLDKAIDYCRRLRARLDGRPGTWDREKEESPSPPDAPPPEWVWGTDGWLSATNMEEGSRLAGRANPAGSWHVYPRGGVKVMVTGTATSLAEARACVVEYLREEGSWGPFTVKGASS